MKIYIDAKALVEYFAQDDARTVVISDDRQRNHDSLRRWLGRYCERMDADAVIVFDDAAPGELPTPRQRAGHVVAINLPYGEQARNEIAGPANRDALEDRTFVVTDDYRLAQSLERGKATVLAPTVFVSRVRRSMGADSHAAEEPDEKFTGLSNEEVNFWMDYFKNDD
jgi:hypothetical protein